MMLPFKIAMRFLKSGRLQTVLIIFGIAIAVSIQVFVGLLISSLQQSLVNETVGNSSQITIIPANDDAKIRDWENIVIAIEGTESVKAVSAVAAASSVVSNGKTRQPVIVRGFNLAAADRIYGIDAAIYQGKQITTRRELLVGRELKEELEIEMGDKIVLVSPDGTSSFFDIAGFYDLGIASINRSWLITKLDTAQQFFGYGNRITSIEITVDDVFNADTVATEIERQLDNSDIEITNWKDENEDLLGALDAQQQSSTIIQVVIIFSVVIAIASVLAISVLQKSRQIGILKAMGIKDRTASLVFIYQGLVIGLFGAIFGISLGLGLLYSFNYFTGGSEGDSVIKLYIEYGFILRSWLIAVAASTLAALIPARKSLQLNPIDVIREG